MEYIKGRGAQLNTPNRFEKNERVLEHFETIDDFLERNRVAGLREMGL